MKETNQLPKFPNTTLNHYAVRIYDSTLKQLLLETERDSTPLNHLLYSSTIVVTNKVVDKIKKKAHERKAHEHPRWEKDIKIFRPKLSNLDELSKRNNVKIKKDKAKIQSDKRE